MLKEMYLGKIFYFFNKKLQEMANENTPNIGKIIKTIIDIYKLLGSARVAEAVSKKMKSYKPDALRKAIKSGEFTTFLVIEPFEGISPKNIKAAADLLKIPLEEKVYIPEDDQWTDIAVPVGISYYNFLEHYSDVYSSMRGSEKYVGLTGQPTKRKANIGGQSLGNLDTFALLSHDVPNIIDELYGARSDDHRSKKILYSGIIQSGQTVKIPPKETTGGTKDLFDLYTLGMGIEIK